MARRVRPGRPDTTPHADTCGDLALVARLSPLDWLTTATPAFRPSSSLLHLPGDFLAQRGRDTTLPGREPHRRGSCGTDQRSTQLRLGPEIHPGKLNPVELSPHFHPPQNLNSVEVKNTVLQKMKTNVSFVCAEEFVPVSEEDGILSAKGAGWFVARLKAITGIEIADELCQEDWGVVVFAKKNGKRFWIGLSQLPDGEHCWLAHVHHAPWTLLQRISSSGRAALDDVVRDLDGVLKRDPKVSHVRWIHEEDLQKARDTWSDSP